LPGLLIGLGGRFNDMQQIPEFPLWSNLPVVILQPSRHVICWTEDDELVYDGITTGTLALDEDLSLFTDPRTEREFTVEGRCSLRLQS
jgi:hypothetical protein